MKNRILNGICAAGLSASFAVSGVAPAVSAPINAPTHFGESAAVTLVAQGRRDNRKKMRRRNGDSYHHGYKGSRNYRRGYRSYNGFWFPLAAFGLGAIIGGTVAGGGNGHVQWCYNHYRSYRAYDNTFQPYNGPRRLCASPYS